MKEGWEYKKLGEIATEMYRGSGIKRDQITKEGTPCVRYGEIYTTYNISFDSCVSYTNKENISSPKYFEHGDLLFAITGESVEDIGKTIAYLGNEKCLCGGDIICMKHQQNPKYLAYALSTPDAIRQKGIGKTKLKVVHTNAPALRSITIPIAPIDKQQSIVDYLDSAFAKIDAMKVNAEKALNEAKALFQASLKEMLEPKEEWEEKKLGDICSDIRYGTSTPSNENGEYKYLRMNNITNDGFLDVSHYKTISLPEKELEKCLVKKGDIIFNRTNSRELVGKSCVFTEDENMVIAGYLIRIRLKEGFEPQFITYNMNLQRSMGLFQHLIVGAVHQANISANNIQKVLISYPPLSEQQSIVSALDSLKSKVDKLQENYDKISQECDALKQAILRQVFE